MNRKYIIAVLIASFVLVVNQVFIQYVLHQKKYDAKTINLAGKQRMLSQKINLEFYKSLEEKQVSPLLPSLFEEWKHTHYTLLNNTRVAKLSPITDPQALSLIAQLSPKVSFVENQLKQLSSKRAVDIPALNTNQAAFLAEMNQVVLLLEKTSSDKLNFIVC